MAAWRASRALIQSLRTRSYHIASRVPSAMSRYALSGQNPSSIFPQNLKNSSSRSVNPFQQLRPRFSSVSTKHARMNPEDYNVQAWTDTPYLEYIVGLEPEGSTPSTSTGGSTLAGISSEKKRPHPGYTARLIRLRLENGASVKAREAILDEKSYMRDFGRFWIPLVADLLGGNHHYHSLEMFAWMKDHPTVMKSGRALEIERLYSMMISYAGVVGDAMLARKWFDDMEQKGMRKSTHCCNALIIAYAKDFDIQSALAIFNGMKHYNRECPPNRLTYFILISMFARYGRWSEMEEMIRECCDSNFKLDDLTIHRTLLHAYARMGRRDLFEDVLQRMKEICVGAEQSEEFSCLLVGYARLNALDKLSEVIEKLLQTDWDLREEIAVPVMEEVAKALSRNSSTQGLEDLIKVLEKNKFKSTSAFQSYVVEAYAKSGKLEDAEAYFDNKIFSSEAEATKREFVEAPALDLVIDAFCKQGMFERIHRICRKAGEAGFAISSSAYEGMILRFARAESYELMERVAAEMEAAGNKWPETTLRVLHEAYEKSGNKVRMNVVVRRMKKLKEEEEQQQQIQEQQQQLQDAEMSRVAAA